MRVGHAGNDICVKRLIGMLENRRRTTPACRRPRGRTVAGVS